MIYYTVKHFNKGYNMIKYQDIPYDLEEMIYEKEHCSGSYSDAFDNEMIKLKLFDYGNTRRSHRIVTDKCLELGYWGTVELLTNRTKQDIEIDTYNERVQKEIETMFNLAKEHGYYVVKNENRQYPQEELDS